VVASTYIHDSIVAGYRRSDSNVYQSGRSKLRWLPWGPAALGPGLAGPRRWSWVKSLFDKWAGTSGPYWIVTLIQSLTATITHTRHLQGSQTPASQPGQWAPSNLPQLLDPDLGVKLPSPPRLAISALLTLRAFAPARTMARLNDKPLTKHTMPAGGTRMENQGNLLKSRNTVPRPAAQRISASGSLPFRLANQQTKKKKKKKKKKRKASISHATTKPQHPTLGLPYFALALGPAGRPPHLSDPSLPGSSMPSPSPPGFPSWLLLLPSVATMKGHSTNQPRNTQPRHPPSKPRLPRFLPAWLHVVDVLVYLHNVYLSVSSFLPSFHPHTTTYIGDLWAQFPTHIPYHSVITRPTDSQTILFLRLACQHPPLPLPSNVWGWGSRGLLLWVSGSIGATTSTLLLLRVFLHASLPGSPFFRLKLAWVPAGLPACSSSAPRCPEGVIAFEHDYRVDERRHHRLPAAATLSPHTPTPHHVTVIRIDETHELSRRAERAPHMLLSSDSSTVRQTTIEGSLPGLCTCT
jgi:hypothetical protein